MERTITITQAFERYRQDVIVYRGQSKRTEEMHLLALKAFLEFLPERRLCDLTFQDVRNWKEHLEKTRGGNTVRGYIIKLRVVLQHAKRMGYECLDPEIIGVPKRSVVPVSFITPQEVDQLIEAVSRPSAGYPRVNQYRNAAVISLLYASGVRVSELCALNRLDIREDNTFTVVGKGGKARLCFIDERTSLLLHKYFRLRDDNDPALLLSDNTGKRISVGTVQEIFRVARRKGGFTKPIHPHTMRHSFATNLLRNNTNLMYVSSFLGHSSVQTTQMYTHVVNEDLKKIYQEKHTI